MASRMLSELKKQLIIFIEELMTTFPAETDLIALKVYVKDQVPESEIMKHMTEKLLPIRNEILSHDEESILSNDMFSFDKLAKQEQVLHFKRLWINLDDEGKEEFWKWFELFVKIVSKYNKLS